MEDKKQKENLEKQRIFIEESKKNKNHQNPDGTPKYDYSKVEYKSNIEKIILVCNLHGEFKISPKKHKVGQGCKPCGIKKRTEGQKSNTEEFIEKAIQVHRDEEGKALFDYSLVKYIDYETPVKIICKKEGHLFEQKPTSHLQKNGCKFCSGSYKRDTNDFVERSKKIHVDENGEPLYDYSEVEYVNTETKVKIKCKKNKEHIFFQTPHHHLNHGCDFCARGMYIMNKEQFVEEALKKHGEKYDYSETIFNGLNEYVTILCKEHGYFDQVALYHTSYARGCLDCGQKKASLESRKTVEEFIEDAKKIHNTINYDYSRVREDYETRSSKVKIGCPNCKTFFTQKCFDHLAGWGCKNCKNKTQRILFAYLREQFGEEFFETEKKFDECKFINHLPFDFYSQEYNLVIELDGRQHFTEVNIFRDTLEERQKKDFIKMEYLQDNNISLIRIFQEDVYENKNDWKNKILNCVQKYDSHQIIYLSSGNHYEEYNRRYEDYYTNNNYIEDLEKLNLTEDYDDEEEVEELENLEEEVNHKANTA